YALAKTLFLEVLIKLFVLDDRSKRFILNLRSRVLKILFHYVKVKKNAAKYQDQQCEGSNVKFHEVESFSMVSASALNLLSISIKRSFFRSLKGNSFFSSWHLSRCR